MNYPINKDAFDLLPYREDIKLPVEGAPYRSRAYKTCVFIYHGPDHRPKWDCFTVEIEP